MITAQQNEIRRQQAMMQTDAREMSTPAFAHIARRLSVPTPANDVGGFAPLPSAA